MFSFRHGLLPSSLCVAVLCNGCGPSAEELREQTLSSLNVEADRWDGEADFKTAATDAYGRPLTTNLSKGRYDYILTVRSAGPDGLPKNSDDHVVERQRPHEERTISGDIHSGVKSLAGGVAEGGVRGVIDGVMRRDEAEDEETAR